MTLFNIIKWDAEPGFEAYRYPNDRIRLGSELFVSQTQQAFLMKAGNRILPGLFNVVRGKED